MSGASDGGGTRYTPDATQASDASGSGTGQGEDARDDGPDGDASPPTVPETAVPPDETPAAVCPYCDRPFRLERARALHVVQDHPRKHTPAERDAYEAARDEEDDDLFVYHLKVVAAISILYTVSVLGYMVVLGAG